MYNLAFIGFGVVGQGLLEILVNKRDWLKNQYGFEWNLVAISDIMKGSKYNPEGLNAKKCLEEVKSNGNINSIDALNSDWDSLKTIKVSNADIIIEVSYTDIKTGQPGLSHVEAAIENGKHVAMTNKGPMVVASADLLKKASSKEVLLRYEGTVMAGTPVLMLGNRSLKASGITQIRGILNGTTNYILTEMEKGVAYEDVLNKAKELGYAEADPTGDISGLDSLGKCIILANTLMGASLSVEDVELEGITNISLDNIKSAAEKQMRWKLIGEILTDPSGKVSASVKPMKIPFSDPLASISGPTNAITFTTDLMGDITVIGAGAGKTETGFALLSDLLDLHTEIQHEKK
ncbi:MAG: Homoserine dehydrogenase [Candidatus Heimdallarchaeota archaeon LC_3]|nr:MAG: Homoserine dehydrogenase [Candidatus Heimdallarchaeota archaeon LC_3]